MSKTIKAKQINTSASPFRTVSTALLTLASLIVTSPAQPKASQIENKAANKQEGSLAPKSSPKEIDKEALLLFEKTLNKYNVSKLVEMNVQKEVISELLGTENQYNGILYLSSGRFRWETKSPEQNLILFDGKILWSVQYPSGDFSDSKIEVTRSVTRSATKSFSGSKLGKKNNDKFFWLSLIGPNSTKEKLKFLSVVQEPKQIQYEIELPQKEVQIKKLIFFLNREDQIIEQVTYSDDVGNKTRLKFQKIQFLKEDRLELFKYVPEKGAQITNI